MPSYAEQVAPLERLKELAVLEEEYKKARDAYTEKDTPARREKFKVAKQEFVDAQTAYRQAEEDAGRRTPGASVGGE